MRDVATERQAAEDSADTIRRVAGEMRAHALKAVEEVQTNPYFGLASDPPDRDPFWCRVGNPNLDIDEAYARETQGGLGGPPLAALFTPSLVAAVADLLENATPYADMAHPGRYPIVADALKVCREWDKAQRALVGEVSGG